MTLKQADLTRHIMVDIETLDTRPGAVILSIGAVPFSRSLKGGAPLVYKDEGFYVVINQTDSQRIGLSVGADTVAWWKKQSPEAREVLDAANSDAAMVVSDAMNKFNDYVRKHAAINPDGKISIWGNGSDFDNVLICEAMRAAEVAPAWSYGKHRCYRTLMALAAYAKHNVKSTVKRAGTHHNALDDAIYQAEVASMALYELGALR